MTALIIEDRQWAGLLSVWLAARSRIHQDFGVSKKQELHAHKLFRGRGRPCDTEEQNSKFRAGEREAVGRILLSALGGFPGVSIFSIGMEKSTGPQVYSAMLDRLAVWAEQHQTFLMIFYDGQQGLPAPNISVDQTQRSQLWETAIRSAEPYRSVHRRLELRKRRIIEDVVMLDSRYSQLIQAVDLISYGAYQKHAQDNPDLWPGAINISKSAIRAYLKTTPSWSSIHPYGMEWVKRKDPQP